MLDDIYIALDDTVLPVGREMADRSDLMLGHRSHAERGAAIVTLRTRHTEPSRCATID